jgi:radical SAM protein with 4Fe4S-binding SPASM domain
VIWGVLTNLEKNRPISEGVDMLLFEGKRIKRGTYLASKLSLSSHVVLRAEPQYYGTYVAFDYKKAQTEFLDEDEYKILKSLCGKAADINQVVIETKINHSKCTSFLKRAIKSEIVRSSETAPEDCLAESAEISPEHFARFPVPILSAPSSVDVFITGKCNLRCIHCFSQAKKPADLSLEDLQSVFDQLEKMRVLEVRINGGEPFMHPDICRILQMLEHRHFRKVIITNGTLLNDEVAKLLKKSNVIPTVSLDDSDATGHDFFRGVEGAFEKTLAGLKSLQKNNVQYGINCCLHIKSIEKVEEIANLALRMGAYRLAFLSLKPLGKMKTHMELLPSQKEYEAAFMRLMLLKAKHRVMDVSLDVFLSCPVMRESALEAKKGLVSCRAGRTIMSIFSDGEVYPCNSVIGDQQWRMGNSKNETLSDIWFSQKWAFFRGAVRINDLKKCRNCQERKNCTDFYCRLLPYEATGDALGPSPNCEAKSRRA